MPLKSKSQARLMEMVAHDPEAAKRLHIKKEVAEDFIQATPKSAFSKLKEKVKSKKK